MIYGELGRYPLDIDIKLRHILYRSKLIIGKDIKLSIISYKLLYGGHLITPTVITPTVITPTVITPTPINTPTMHPGLYHHIISNRNSKQL